MPKLIEIRGVTSKSGWKVSAEHLGDFLNGRCTNSDGVHTFKLVFRGDEDAVLLALVESESDYERLMVYDLILPAEGMDGKDLMLTVLPCNNSIYLEHLISLRDKELNNMPNPVKRINQDTAVPDKKPQPRPRKSLSTSKIIQNEALSATNKEQPSESLQPLLESKVQPNKNTNYSMKNQQISEKNLDISVDKHENHGKSIMHPVKSHEYSAKCNRHSEQGLEYHEESYDNPKEIQSFKHLKESHGHLEERHGHFEESHGHLEESHGHLASRNAKESRSDFEESGVTDGEHVKETHSEIDKYKVFIENIHPKTSEECLCNFVESRGNAIPVDIIYGDVPGTALVMFSEEPDMNGLEEGCKKRPVEGSYLRVSPVEKPLSVRVFGLPPRTSADSVKFVLENRRKGPGAQVDSVEILPLLGEAVVLFKHSSDAEKVCDRSLNIQVEGSKVNLKLHYPYLYSTQSMQCDPAQPSAPNNTEANKVTYHELEVEVENNILHFLSRSEMYYNKLEDELRELGAVPVLKKQDNSLISLQIKSSEFLNAKLVETLVFGFIGKNRLISHEFHLDPKLHKDVHAHLIKTMEHLKQEVRVYKVSDHLTVVGENTSVLMVLNEMQKIKELLTRMVLGNLELKSHQVKFLIVSKYEKCLRKDFPDLNVILDTIQNRVTFNGTKSDIGLAKQNVLSYLCSVLKKEVHFENEAVWCLLKQNKTKEYLEEVLDQSRIVCCIDVQENTHVVRVYATSEEDVTQGRELIKKSIVEMQFHVSHKSHDCLCSSDWKDMKQLLKDKHPGKLIIEVQGTNVILVTTEDIANNVQAQMGNYFKTKAIQQQKFELIKPMCQYFKEIKQEHIHLLESELHSENVKIEFYEQGLFVCGYTQGLEKAIDELNKMKSKVCFNELKLKQPGIKEFLTKEDGKDVILFVGKKHKCVIIPETEAFENTRGLKSAVDVNKKWLRPGGRTVSVHLGDITELKVDAIVNAANSNLSHGGGIARAIVEKGGSSIEAECSDYIEQHGSLSDGKVYTSLPGLLPCKAIIHAVGPMWQGGNYSEHLVLVKTVENILKEANQHEFTSVAMPAISTGIFNYPLEAAVSVLVKALLDYWEDKEDYGQRGSVTDICFCDINKKTISTFVSILDKMCGEDGATASYRKSSSNSENDDPENDSDLDCVSSHSASNDMPSSGDSVVIVTGNLADQKVDAVVSPVSENLDLSVSAVSKSLLLKGGEYLQDECHQKYPDGLNTGDICEVSAGSSLTCQMLYFGCLKKMDSKGLAKKILNGFVTSCLELAASKSLTSVAFPALGSGKLGFPADISASLMYDAVKLHFENCPSSTVQKILFVIHPRDTAVLKAFESQAIKSGYSQSNTIQEYRPTKKHHHEKDFQDNHPSSSNQDMLQFGNIRVQVVKGDITEEKTDCIVNSTNSNLDLKTGAVSRALLAQAGPDLEEDCENKRDYMKKNGVALTSSGNLNCKSILHIKAQTSKAGWHSILAKALSLVDKNGITSLSIPALGTGGQRGSAENMAPMIAGTIKEFGLSYPSSNLKFIRVVIFHGYMFNTFKRAFTGGQEHFPGHAAHHGHRPKHSEHSPRQLMDESFVVTIYAEGKMNVDAAKEEFIEQCRKRFDKKTIRKDLCGKFDDLNDQQKKAVHDKARKIGCDLSMSHDGMLEIFGLKEKVSAAYDMILEMLLSFKKSAEMQKDAKVLAKLVQWYYIDQHRESQAFSRGNNAQLEKAYNNSERYLEIKDPKGRQYKVDLKKMEEYPLRGKSVKIHIVRSDTHGSSQSQMVEGEKEAMAGNKTVYFTLRAERSHKDTAEEHHYRTAESQFLRLLGKAAAQYCVVKVEYVMNPVLIKRFRVAKQNLKKTRGEDMSHPVLAFHGTKVDNIKKICEDGFLAPGDPGFVMNAGNKYGGGVYFSEYPGYSMGYISGASRIMLCQVLLGKAYTCPHLMHGSTLQVGYDSHVSPCGKELIIFNTSHILPSYIVHYGPSSLDFKYT